MARTKGSANFSGTIEALAGGALDARSVVPAKADLTASGSFPYPYIGMETYVVAEDKKYRLIGADPTDLANWEELGNIEVDDEISSTSENPVQNKVIKSALDTKPSMVNGKVPRQYTTSDVVEVYLDSGVMYYDSAHTQRVSGEKDRLYLEVPSKTLYRYISEGQSHTFQAVGGKSSFNLLEDRPTKEVTSMSNIVTPLPGATPRYMKYSTEEQVIGEWIDGKPVYQKTFDFGSSLTDTQTQQEWLEPIGASVDRVVRVWGNMYNGADPWGSCLPYYAGDNSQTYAIIGAYANSASDTSKKNKVGIYWRGTCAWITDPIITLQYTKTTD